MVNISGQLSSAAYWLGLPLLITSAGFLPGSLFSHSVLLMLYLCAVLFTALRASPASIMLCALAGFLFFNFFHTQPRFSFYMHDADELMSAVLFIVFAVLSGLIASRLNRQLLQLRIQRDFFSAQVAFYREMQVIRESSDLPELLRNHFGRFFDDAVSFRLEEDQETGLSKIEIENLNERHGDTDGREILLPSLKEQVQSALDRLSAEKALKAAERSSDEEKLRSALLSSVSHDLKTPLVTMLGAATTLRDLRKDLSSQDAEELLDSIISESQRLESYIQNLLDMTRLGHSGLSLSRDWVHIEEIYHVVRRRLDSLGAIPRVSLNLQAELSLLHVHAALIEQGLFNVLDNAVKVSGPGDEIRVDVIQKEGRVDLIVSDMGPGLPRSEWKAVFDPFHTFSLGDCYEKGTGLGLSICHSIFTVHGGNVEIIEPVAGFNHSIKMSLPTGDVPDESTDIE